MLYYPPVHDTDGSQFVKKLLDWMTNWRHQKCIMFDCNKIWTDVYIYDCVFWGLGVEGGGDGSVSVWNYGYIIR